MASLIEVRRLLHFSDHRQQRCEQALGTARRRLSPLEQELGAIDQQVEGFRELLLSNRLEAQTVSHSQLFAQLRRQAVIRRQIANLDLERARVRERHGEVLEQLDDLQQRRKSLLGRHAKYEHLEQRLLAEQRARRWRLEEHDIEELWVKKK
jgi:chromosome segregation ATPase